MMEYDNILEIDNRKDFREWLKANHNREKECWICVKKGKPGDDKVFYYIDAVEEALCFGWIDSVSYIIDGKRRQRFSPRLKNGYWSELNKERVKRLEKLGMMTDAGRAVLPEMDIEKFRFDDEFLEILGKNGLEDIFFGFPALYQRVRSTNIMRTKINQPKEFRNTVANFIEKTKEGKMYGDWNDNGRLSDYRFSLFPSENALPTFSPKTRYEWLNGS